MRIRETSVRASEIDVGGDEDLGGVAVFFDLENIVLGVDGEFTVKPIIDALNEGRERFESINERGR